MLMRSAISSLTHVPWRKTYKRQGTKKPETGAVRAQKIHNLFYYKQKGAENSHDIYTEIQ